MRCRTETFVCHVISNNYKTAIWSVVCILLHCYMFIAVIIFSYAREGSESSGTFLRFDLKGIIELEGQITPENGARD